MSKALKKLQEKCGSNADGSFGPNTAKKICDHYALNPERGAHFLGQLVHESGTFRYTQENLNYSKESILGVFGKYFKDPSNKNIKYLRTKIRDLKRPLEKSGVKYEQIFRSIQNLSSSKNTLDNYLDKICNKLIRYSYYTNTNYISI